MPRWLMPPLLPPQPHPPTPHPAEDAGSVYSLCPADAKGPDGEFWGVQYSQELGKYLGPFVMQVRRAVRGRGLVMCVSW